MKQLVKTWLAFFILLAMTLALTLYAMKTGSLYVTWGELLGGLFVAYNPTVAIIYDMRLPRILVALMAGGALATSGLLFQSTLKNPLADPGIIGISGGALFVSTLISTLFPALFFSIPLFACVGGVVAYVIIYSLSWRGSLDPVRIILVGVAVAAVFSGLTAVLGGLSNSTGVSMSTASMTQLVWRDVRVLAIYTAVGLILALLFSPVCNIMALEDGTIRGLGVNVDRYRLIISFVAVLLCAGTTAVVGVIGFLALVAPHMGRKIVGSDHKVLTPFTILLGAFILLLADTLGRLLFAPVEVSASVFMSVIGGPCFIFLLRREGNRHGS